MPSGNGTFSSFFVSIESLIELKVSSSFFNTSLQQTCVFLFVQIPAFKSSGVTNGHIEAGWQYPFSPEKFLRSISDRK